MQHSCKDWYKTKWLQNLSQTNGDNVNSVRYDTSTAEPLVSEPSSFEVEIATEELKRYKSPGTDQIPDKIIQTGCNNTMF
jgi:hypothetical protein